MALWAHVQSLPRDVKIPIFIKYNQVEITAEVRHYLAVWIESQLINSNNGQLVSIAEKSEESLDMFHRDFIRVLEETASRIDESNAFFHSFILMDVIRILQGIPPSDLYSRLHACLSEEMRVVYEFQQAQRIPARVETEEPAVNPKEIIDKRLVAVGNVKTEWQGKINSLKSTWADYKVRVHEKRLLDENFINGNGVQYSFLFDQILVYETHLQTRTTTLTELTNDSMSLASQMVAELNNLIPSLVQPGGFIHQLRWSEIRPSPENQPSFFSSVQKWYKDSLDVFKQLEQFWNSTEFTEIVRDFQFEAHRETAKALTTQIRTLYSLLLSNSLVVQSQPPQVLKQLSKLQDITVRFLIEDSVISGHASQMPKVKAFIVNEHGANSLHTSGIPKIPEYEKSKVVNNEKNKSADSPLVEFKAMKISNARRSQQIRDVLREKMCLLFYTEFESNVEKFKVWCCGNPGVYIVGNNQRTEALATMFWDDFLREENRIAFHVQDPVPWSRMQRALSEYFKRETKTTNWNLTPANLEEIGKKLLKTEHLSPEMLVNQNMLHTKDLTIDKEKHSFWEWFSNIVELTAKFFPDAWDSGCIIGFTDRSRVETEILNGKEVGTFLLRFSDSCLGGISVSRVYSPNKISNLAPFKKADLTKLSLAERICGAEQFKSVAYFDRLNVVRLGEKTQAFQRSNRTDSATGHYVRTKLKMEIEKEEDEEDNGMLLDDIDDIEEFFRNLGNSPASNGNSSSNSE